MNAAVNAAVNAAGDSTGDSTLDELIGDDVIERAQLLGVYDSGAR
ncbi:hypothetical protein [Streptomyces malaysiensis]